jgi:hypothetical protein
MSKKFEYIAYGGSAVTTGLGTIAAPVLAYFFATNLFALIAAAVETVLSASATVVLAKKSKEAYKEHNKEVAQDENYSAAARMFERAEAAQAAPLQAAAEMQPDSRLADMSATAAQKEAVRDTSTTGSLNI